MNDVTAQVADDGTVMVTGVNHEVALVFHERGGMKGLEFKDAATARAVAHAILDADRHPTGDRELKAKGL